MSWFPATKINISNWEYFSVKMTFGDFFDENRERKNDLISFATDLTEDGEMPSVLDEWLQRKLNEGRAKGSIADYLLDKDDYFFSSVVIACLGDLPRFEPTIHDADKLASMGIDDMRDTGFVKFDRNQKYFILDGQHRLFAIRSILEEPELRERMPVNFLDQGINVLLVNKGVGEDQSAFKEKYRRLFTSLNRYAKSTNTETNIIMDEDDAYYILTRRLIQDSNIFKFNGSPDKNPHIDINSASIQQGASYLTSLGPLAQINEIILSNQKILEIYPESKKKKEYRVHRPDDGDLNFFYHMLEGTWNALIHHFPELNDVEKRVNMRSPNAPLSEEGVMDHAFLRPLSQTGVMAPIIRELLDSRLDTKEGSTNLYSHDEFVEALKPLTYLEWDLRKAPFINLLLVNKPKNPGDKNYVMTEGATSKGERVARAKEICLFLLDDGQSYNEKYVDRLKAMAINDGTFKNSIEEEEWWDEIMEIKEKVQQRYIDDI